MDHIGNVNGVIMNGRVPNGSRGGVKGQNGN